MNINLKHALIDLQIPQYKVAQMLGVPHTAISKFIAGIQEPTEEQKKRLSEILGTTEEELFPASNKRPSFNRERNNRTTKP